jgi:hypothetical protein
MNITPCKEKDIPKNWKPNNDEAIKKWMLRIQSNHYAIVSKSFNE